MVASPLARWPMPKLFITVGLPGSGKSTWILSNCQGADWHSADYIREELFGSQEIQGDARLVFGLMEERVRASLDAGHDVVYDATNVCRKWRELPASFDEAERIAVVFTTPLEVCLERNARRSRHVPEAVIKWMDKIWEDPSLSEGFDQILIVN